jgi:hypothetical protein
LDKTIGKGLGKVGGFWVDPRFLLCVGSFIVVNHRFRVLLFGETTNHPSGLQWCPFLTPKWHAGHDNEDSATAIRILHGGISERRAGGGGTSIVPVA